MLPQSFASSPMLWLDCCTQTRVLNWLYLDLARTMRTHAWDLTQQRILSSCAEQKHCQLSLEGHSHWSLLLIIIRDPRDLFLFVTSCSCSLDYTLICSSFSSLWDPQWRKKGILKQRELGIRAEVRVYTSLLTRVLPTPTFFEIPSSFHLGRRPPTRRRHSPRPEVEGRRKLIPRIPS